ncbi:RNA polymerase sigma factor [Bdellovibrio sp. HCB337]|uniref:RNA polymerase sigma factor n=1 Tax=Bdellovibrio sp. HCB337 TaxID=3394358 RepID=UPI0039A77AAF
MAKNIDWDEVVEDLGPRLFKYFCVRFSSEQADDLTQETLIRLVRKVEDGKFDPDKGTLKMLGFGIAHYVALETKPSSHESIEDWEETLEIDTNLEQMTIEKDAAFKVREHFKNLSAIEQQILSLSVDEDLHLHEISMILQVPEGTVKSHIFRAKKKIVALIQKETVL